MQKIISLLLLCLSTCSFGKDIRLIVSYSPGGFSDLVARAVQRQLAEANVTTIVEYKPGAGGRIGFNYVAKTKSETVLVIASNQLTDGVDITPTDSPNIETDFKIIKHLGTVPPYMLVSESSGIKSLRELNALSKKRTIYYGSAGIGSGLHISAAIAINGNGNFVHVPFKGGSDGFISLMRDDLQFLMESEAVFEQYVISKRVRPIAVLASRRTTNYPQVATLREQGINDYNYTRWFALVSNSAISLGEKSTITEKLNSNSFLHELSKIGLTKSSTDVKDNFLVEQAANFKAIQRTVNLD